QKYDAKEYAKAATFFGIAKALAPTKADQFDRDIARVRSAEGSDFLDDGNLEEAEKRFKQAEAINPKLSSAFAGLAGVRAKQKQFVAASDLLLKAADLEKGNKENAALLRARAGDNLADEARAQLAQDRLAEAETFFKQAADYSSEKEGSYRVELAVAYQKRGDALLEKKDYEAAIDAYEDAEKREPPRKTEMAPSWAGALSETAKSWLQRKNAVEALIDLGQAVSLQPKNGGLLIQRADVFVSTGKVDEAVADLSAAAKLDRAMGAKLLKKAADLVAAGAEPAAAKLDLPTVDAALKRSISLAPDDEPEFRLRFGKLLRQGAVAAAKAPGAAKSAETMLASLDQADLLDPTGKAEGVQPRKSALLALAADRKTAGDFPAAIQRYRAILDLDPKGPSGRSGLLDSYLALAGEMKAAGKTDDALKAFSDALALYDEVEVVDAAKPVLASAYAARGRIYKEMKNAEASDADFEQAFSLDPVGQKEFGNVVGSGPMVQARKLLKAGKPTDARVELEKVRKVNAKFPGLARLEAEILTAEAAAADPTAALSLLDKATQLYPEGADKLDVQRAALYAKRAETATTDQDGAIADFKQAMKLDPSQAEKFGAK
ncbi:MAG: hypothetical protein ACRDD1_13265, partial [Planctomycetia bacterium]